MVLLHPRRHLDEHEWIRRLARSVRAGFEGKDPEKLMNLIAKINRALEACQENRHNCVDARSPSQGIVAQLSQPAESEC